MVNLRSLSDAERFNHTKRCLSLWKLLSKTSATTEVSKFTLRNAVKWNMQNNTYKMTIIIISGSNIGH